MKNSKINSIKAREILDSRGNPTIEAELKTKGGVFCASVPSGASRGKYEAAELRDGGKRYHGMGVLKAVRNVNEIIGPKLKGKNPTKQKEIDELMIKLDGTKNKSRLGANAILAVSMAVCRAGAAAKNTPLYQHISKLAENSSPLTLPGGCFNVINGGVHAGNELDFQEFMIVPYTEISEKFQSGRPAIGGDRPKVKTFKEYLRMAVEIYQELKKTIKEKYTNLSINVGDEGGFAPPLRVPEEALNLILEVLKKLGYQEKIKIILDIAASQFFSQNKYKMKIGEFSSEELVNYYLDLIKKYSISGLEDPFSEEDWGGWKMLSSKFKVQSSKLLIIGDDLLVTNPERIKEAQKNNLCNALILKPNQIGTITQAIEAARLALKFGWKIIVSHRSGETNDDFISDLAVGISADFIKAGAPARGERVAKYNRLLRIEEKLKN